MGTSDPEPEKYTPVPSWGVPYLWRVLHASGGESKYHCSWPELLKKLPEHIDVIAIIRVNR
ncbi:MAG: hypothetical protein PHI12_06475 [Dehalococcoidales bacterium]|nr:hypothetical protein [Dehalococcoidales bacterium]